MMPLAARLLNRAPSRRGSKSHEGDGSHEGSGAPKIYNAALVRNLDDAAVLLYGLRLLALRIAELAAKGKGMDADEVAAQAKLLPVQAKSAEAT